GVLGPAVDAGLEEGAVDNQLTTAFEQVEQVYLTLGPFEFVHLLHRHPRHPSTFGGQRITRTSQGFLLHEETLARCLPFLLLHDWRCFYSELPFAVHHFFRFVPVHVSLLFLIHPTPRYLSYLCWRSKVPAAQLFRERPVHTASA